ncbi:MAG: hypothetical protein JNK30_22890, partial [Phenylobacterium sp.]|uniref:hypothetical protein n=1 Tax=Phenylobacterium sp. TaxID=1871053 RepID=UPI001A411625
MRDNRARPPGRKLSLVAPLVIAALVAVVLALAWFASRPADAPATPPPQVTPPAPEPTAAAEPALLTRADLIAAAETAARSEASEQDRRPGPALLEGRAFRVAIPFGCDGPQGGAGPAQAGYALDAETRTLRITARPIDWTTLPLVREAADASRIEAVEGFWIPRPWRASDSCPPRRDRPALATPTPPAPQTVGLAHVFETGSSRLERRSDRPYQTTRKLGPDAPLPLATPFQLVLEGRVAAWPDGKPVRCWSESADHRPICLVAVDLQKVTLLDPVSG